MPYFKNNNINILFIHIPKTGGTSLEKYFCNKFNFKLDNTVLYSPTNHNLNNIINSSLQHMTYETIIKYNNIFNINFNNITVISIVRNPYERIISDLFFFNLININNTKKEIYKTIKKYILNDKLDNHNIPQYKFITTNNKLIKNIKLLKTETLTTDMHNLGYNDFNMCINKNSNGVNYYDYLNKDSIKIINKFYHLDFVLFNYDKI
jgi:hypothetical protein